MLSLDERRRQNVLDNKRILAELGFSNPFKERPKVVHDPIKRKRPHSGDRDHGYGAVKRAKKQFTPAVLDDASQTPGSRRRSCRLQGQEPGSVVDADNIDDSQVGESTATSARVAPHRPNTYGAIPGVEVGTHWWTRMECCHAGIHRPPVAGIHGNEEEGAYSLALSGGYEDDVDLGVCFTYTGEGGRDLKGTKNNPKNLRTASQSKDQNLTRGNLALSKNIETGNPVRVIRGYKLDSDFAPQEGYRYDGLYTVEKHWFTTGLSGYGVWKFALRRCDDQDPPPWHLVEADGQDSGFGDGENDRIGDTGRKEAHDAKGNENCDSERNDNAEGNEIGDAKDERGLTMDGVRADGSEHKTEVADDKATTQRGEERAEELSDIIADGIEKVDVNINSKVDCGMFGGNVNSECVDAAGGIVSVRMIGSRNDAVKAKIRMEVRSDASIDSVDSEKMPTLGLSRNTKVCQDTELNLNNGDIFARIKVKMCRDENEKENEIMNTPANCTAA